MREPQEVGNNLGLPLVRGKEETSHPCRAEGRDCCYYKQPCTRLMDNMLKIALFIVNGEGKPFVESPIVGGMS